MKKWSMVNLFVSALFTTSLLVPSSVAAENVAALPVDSVELHVRTAQTYKGSNVPQSVNDYLTSQGVEISNNSQVCIQYCTEANDMAISAVLFNTQNMKNINGTTIEENAYTLTVFESPLDATSLDFSIDDWDADFPPPSWGDDPLSITAIASSQRYDLDIDDVGGGLVGEQLYTCYRPLSCTATCYYTESPMYFTVYYICEGFVADVQSESWIGEDTDVHTITVSASSPVAGRTYSTYDPYTSNRALYTGSGSPNIGEFLTFMYRYQGDDNYKSYTVSR